MATRRIVVVGAGGFAREVTWLVHEINRAGDRYEHIGYVVSDLSRLGPHDSVDQVLGDMDWLDRNRAKVDALAMGIGTPAAKLKVSDEILERFPEFEWPVLVHPTATFDRPSASLGAGVVICAGVLGTVGLTLEPFAMVNLGCTLGHEAHLGRGAVLNPTVNISGGVRLGRGVLVGTGAQILQYVEVGAGVTIGAGAVVTKNVPDGVTVVGIPARPLSR